MSLTLLTLQPRAFPRQLVIVSQGIKKEKVIKHISTKDIVSLLPGEERTFGERLIIRTYGIRKPPVFKLKLGGNFDNWRSFILKLI